MYRRIVLSSRLPILSSYSVRAPGRHEFGSTFVLSSSQSNHRVGMRSGCGSPLFCPVSNLHRSQHQLAHKTPGGTDNNGNGLSPPTTSSSTDPTDKLTTHNKLQTKKVNFFNFIFARLLGFLDRYQQILEKKFPGAMTVYRVFVVGFKDFSIETKEYVKIKKRVIMDAYQVSNLSLEKIDIYYRLPGEICKVGPTLLISALPFANYVVFPIAYYFPKRLLSSHFWSPEQKAQFACEYHTQRFRSYRPLLRQMQKYVMDLDRDRELQGPVQEVLYQLGSGVHPTVEEILKIAPVFTSVPDYNFSLRAIHGGHVKSLCHVHGIHTIYFRRTRLFERARMIRNMDIVLQREGLRNLKTEYLRDAAYLRGLNASDATTKQMMEYLEDWMIVSNSLKPNTYSLLLHLPVLLSYNHPLNWAILSNEKFKFLKRLERLSDFILLQVKINWKPMTSVLEKVASQRSGINQNSNNVPTHKDHKLSIEAEDHELIDTGHQRNTPSDREILESNSSPFKQQRLHAIKPNFSADKIFPVCFVLGLITLTLGILILSFTVQIQEYSIDYTKCKSIEEPSKTCADIIGTNAPGPETNNCTCNEQVKLDDRFKAKKVLMFYKLTNFYQNHRKYLRSKDLKQMSGDIEHKVSRSCVDYDKNNGKPIWPCGALANSFFQDEIKLVSNKSGEYVKLETNGIIRDYEESGYKNPPDWNTTKFTDKYALPKNWKHKSSTGIENKDFMNWMRPAPFSDFRKLYRITENLEDGLYLLEINYSYSVHGFGGTKSIILTTTSPFTESKNIFVGVSYVVVGSTLIIVGVLALLLRFLIPTNQGDLIHPK